MQPLNDVYVQQRASYWLGRTLLLSVCAVTPNSSRIVELVGVDGVLRGF